MKLKNALKLGLLATSMGMAGAANATLITISGTTSAGATVDASVDFTVDTTNSTLTAVVTNLLSNQTSVGQNVSGLYFDISGISNLTLGSQNAPTTVDVASDGSYTTAGTNVSPGWGFTSGAPSGVSALSGAVSTPEYTILGAPGTNGYTNANNSITGNKPHNPFIYETATFVFNFTQTEQPISLSNVQMNFGTTTDTLCSAGGSCTTASVPEPGSLALIGVGLLGLWFSRRISTTRA